MKLNSQTTKYWMMKLKKKINLKFECVEKKFKI